MEFDLEEFIKQQSISTRRFAGIGRSGQMMLEAIKKMSEYSKLIKSETLDLKELGLVFDESLKYYAKVNDELIASTNYFQVVDWDRYQKVQQQFIMSSLDLHDSYFTAEIKAKFPGKTRESNTSSNLIDLVEPKSFEEKAKNMIEKDSPQYGYDYFTTSHVEKDKNVGVFIYASENGISYGFSTAYFAWEDKDGQVQLKKLADTSETIDNLFFKGLIEIDGAYKVDISMPRKVDSNVWEKYLTVDKKFMNLADENLAKLTLEEKLKSEGFFEEHAKIISDDIQNTFNVEIQEGSPVEIASRNKVYYLQDATGSKKTIKFYENKKEAEMEAAVNFYFFADSELAELVPGSNLRRPLEFEVAGKQAYAVVENDVRGQTVPDIFDPKSQSSRKQYFGNWMRKLALLHTKGSEIMSMIQNFDKAQNLLRERDKDRIDIVLEGETTKLVQEAYDRISIDEQVFINQDLKLDNRVGQKIVDWGNAGRGSPYADVAMVLNDQRVKLSEEEKQHYVMSYLQIRMQYEQGTINQRHYDIKKEMQSYKTSEYLLTTLLTAIYEQKGKIISPASNSFKQVLKERQKEYELHFKKSKMLTPEIEVECRLAS